MVVSVDALLREALRTSESPVPADAAVTAFAKIKRADYGDALLSMMKIRASQMSSTERTEAVRGLVRPFRSRKQDAIRSHWERLLSARVLVAGEWMRLGDMTAEHCRIVAGQRRQEADELLAQAEKFDQIASILDSSGAMRVSDLPQADADDLLSEMAA